MPTEIMMNLFLDANIYLSFYHFTNDLLEELRKLEVAIKSGEVRLYITDQVVNEFLRNREGKILDALNTVKKESLNSALPQICREQEEEAAQVMKAIEDYKEAKKKMLAKVEDNIRNRNLKADQIINSLFKIAKMVKPKRSVLLKAWERSFRGNPPGKDNSNGDAINWECLLDAIKEGEPLYLIADDKDYRSKIDDERLSPYLEREWRGVKKSDIYYYRRLSTFFAAKFPRIRLATELEKHFLIRSLAASPSFKATRDIVKNLSKFTDYTDAEVNDIAQAATKNNQVYWLNDDMKLRFRLASIIKGHEKAIDLTTYKTFILHFVRPRITNPRDADLFYENILKSMLDVRLADDAERANIEDLFGDELVQRAFHEHEASTLQDEDFEEPDRANFEVPDWQPPDIQEPDWQPPDIQEPDWQPPDHEGPG